MTPMARIQGIGDQGAPDDLYPRGEGPEMQNALESLVYQ